MDAVLEDLNVMVLDERKETSVPKFTGPPRSWRAPEDYTEAGNWQDLTILGM